LFRLHLRQQIASTIHQVRFASDGLVVLATHEDLAAATPHDMQFQWCISDIYARRFALHPNEDLLAVNSMGAQGSHEGKLQLRKHSGETVTEIPDLVLGESSDVVFAEDGAVVAVCGGMGGTGSPVGLFNVPSGEPIGEISDVKAKRLAVSPDGNLLACGCDGGFVSIVDVKTRKEASRFDLFQKNPNSLAFSPDGTSVLAGAGGGYPDEPLWLLDLGTKEKLRFGDNKLFSSNKDNGAVASDTSFALLPANVHGIEAFKWDTREHLGSLRDPGTRNYVTSLDLSPCGKWLAAGAWQGIMSVWEIHADTLDNKGDE